MVKAPRPIPQAVRDAQTRASNPAASAFVSANAGSGKTHVLVQRVIRLLLDGVTIDFADTATQTGLVFHDPKQVSCSSHALKALQD